MKGRQSRYVTGGESFAEIARLPSGAVVRLCLNTGLEDALRRPPNRSSQPSPVPGENAGCQRARRRVVYRRRQGVATHLFVSVL